MGPPPKISGGESLKRIRWDPFFRPRKKPPRRPFAPRTISFPAPLLAPGGSLTSLALLPLVGAFCGPLNLPPRPLISGGSPWGCALHPNLPRKGGFKVLLGPLKIKPPMKIPQSQFHNVQQRVFPNQNSLQMAL